jgi:F-type H+-transporting ATPase subunit delta
MNTETVARRYSTALADVVLASGEAETAKTELAVFGQMIDANGDLTSMLSNPSIAHSSKEKVLEELLKKVKPTKTTANFLRVLLRNNRLTELAEINDRFDSVLEERSGVVSVEVTSARELPDKERKEFERTIKKLTGKQVKLTYAIDENIIGGVVTRIGSTVYDGSVKTKLEKLKTELIGA